MFFKQILLHFNVFLSRHFILLHFTKTTKSWHQEIKIGEEQHKNDYNVKIIPFREQDASSSPTTGLLLKPPP